MAAVIIQAPTTAEKTNWSSSLCSCCQDLNSCCYAYWCCPCFACTTTNMFGESRCLPLVDILGPAFMGNFGFALCVPPVTLSLRVAMRHKYNIKVLVKKLQSRGHELSVIRLEDSWFIKGNSPYYSSITVTLKKKFIDLDLFETAVQKILDARRDGPIMGVLAQMSEFIGILKDSKSKMWK